MINGLALREYLDMLGKKYDLSFSTLRYRYYTITKEGLEPSEDNLVFHSRWLKR